MNVLYDLPLALTVPVHGRDLRVTLTVPTRASGLIVVAHSERLVHHRHLTKELQAHGFATLRLDPSGHDYAPGYAASEIPIDDDQCAANFLEVIQWIRNEQVVRGEPLGYCGIGDYSGMVLIAAATRPDIVDAVVSCGQHLEFNVPTLAAVRAPTLLVTDGEARKRGTDWRFTARHRRVTAEGVARKMSDAPAFSEVGRLAVDWFTMHLRSATAIAGRPVANHAKPSSAKSM